MGQRPKVSGGFTLLELIVTLLILAVAAAVVAPAIGRSLDTIKARADVAGFAATLRHARERAISTGRTHTVLVDPAEHRLTIVGGEDGAQVTRTIPPRLRVEANPPSALSVRFEPQGVSSGGDFRVTSGGVTYRLTIEPLTGRVRSERG